MAKFDKASKDDLIDYVLQLERIIKEISPFETMAMVCAGVQESHEVCVSCGGQGFKKRVACSKCDGLGKVKLRDPVKLVSKLLDGEISGFTFSGELEQVDDS